jgi:hypothetical protein
VPGALKALWKWLLSFRKRNWQLEDYPVVFRAQSPDPKSPYENNSRFKTHQWRALIVNWSTMDGLGDTREEAFDKLRASFTERKAKLAQDGKPLPRPGTRVPIEFASQVLVNTHPGLKQDFIQRVLDLEEAFITDQSSLWDFHVEENNDAPVAKIREVYGVDVSDIESGNLVEILDRIAASRETR